MRLVLFTVLALISLAAGAAKYVPANDSQPLLRRDLLPLDVDSIRELATHLAILADGPTPGSPRQFRHRMQLLTLSKRLSPAEPRARVIENAFKDGENRPAPNRIEAKTAKREVLAAAGWLAKRPKNSEGRRLGQLLLDVLQPLAEKDPLLKLRDAKGASKRWQGVVANIDAFATRKTPTPSPVTPAPVPDTPDPQPAEDASFTLTKVLTEVPMISVGTTEGDMPFPGLIETSLIITEAGEEGGNLRFQPEVAFGFQIEPLQKRLTDFFTSQSLPLPTGSNLNIETSGRRYFETNGDNILAPLAMMLDSAISGRALRRNTILLAHLHENGTLGRPALPWNLILHLEKLRMPPETRLIVGPGMIEELTALLVMEKPHFFTKYEVIEAPTFETARELFYENGAPPANLTQAIKGYQLVRTKGKQANNLPSFLSLKAVEVRLVKARNFSPRHLSAKMLATQAIRRPDTLSPFMFAQELDRRLEEISNFKYAIDKSPDRSIKAAYKKTRDHINSMERLLRRSEIDILKNAVEILRPLNSVGRGASAILDNEEEIRQRDLATFQANLKAFREKLRQDYQPADKK